MLLQAAAKEASGLRRELHEQSCQVNRLQRQLQDSADSITDRIKLVQAADAANAQKVQVSPGQLEPVGHVLLVCATVRHNQTVPAQLLVSFCLTACVPKLTLMTGSMAIF